ncbi:hypothetical protein AKJ38_02900 [candidate division MSBL1 archaeon SCGC-AAA259I14]|uniref:histidine kinase n=1 Tax=candidate division MSBL1 archaeon SCGC-AAA259I14 TaxID=1698268 RepID=A0A133UR31_9EURY|nr:hypothetical protein AKJ38_02900 [candidate division MSBL1 archaeon SCGC-AAA259I14]
MKVLLVDDETSILDQGKIFLEKEDDKLDVETTSSAEKALEMLNNSRYDVIVSDYQMPEMDGLEFLKAVREERNSDVPFILFTGKGREEVAIDALNLGADRYLKKGDDPKPQYVVLADAIVQEVERSKSKERYETLFTNMPVGFSRHEMIFDDEGNPLDYRFLQVNEAFEELTGLEREEIIGERATEVLEDLSKERWIDRVGEVALTGDSINFEEYSAPLDKWYKVNAYSQEKGYFTTVFYDITELKQVSKDFEETLGGFPGHVFRVRRDEEGNFFVTLSEGQIAEKFDITTEKVEGGGLSELFPEDVSPKVFEHYERAFSGEQTKFQVSIKGRWFETELRPYAENGDGEVIEVIGHASDITERKRAEEELEEARDDYRSITNLTGDIIVQVDTEGRWTFLNDGACEFWGKPKEELIGSTFGDYLHPDDQEKTMDAVENMMESGETVKGLVNRQKTPEGWRTVQWNGAPIFEDGEYIGFQATGRDITERKKAEENLKRYKKTVQSGPFSRRGGFSVFFSPA